MSLPQFQTEYKRCMAYEFLTAGTVDSTVFWVVMREVRQKLSAVERKHCPRNVGELLPDYTPEDSTPHSIRGFSMIKVSYHENIQTKKESFIPASNRKELIVEQVSKGIFLVAF